MRHHLPTATLFTAGLLAGCSTAPRLTDAVRVDAYDSAGRTTTNLAALRDHETQKPVIFEFEEGDVIELVLDVDATPWLESSGDGSVRVMRSLEAHFDGRTLFLREPGGRFEKASGTVEVGLALSDEIRRNQVRIAVTLK